MQKIIEIKNATVYRGQTCVFENFSLDLTEGQNTVILGPNGAGKSTLLKLLSRDLYPVAQAESYVRLYGQERWDVWELRSRFGLVSHDLQQQYVGNARGLNIILSGFYSSIDIAWHHSFSDDDRTRAQKVLDTLGISALQEKTYATMSTGEQRRFLLGRALINDPETLVLDEPTSGLDLQACFQYIADHSESDAGRQDGGSGDPPHSRNPARGLTGCPVETGQGYRGRRKERDTHQPPAQCPV